VTPASGAIAVTGAAGSPFVLCDRGSEGSPAANRIEDKPMVSTTNKAPASK
jgi:hypothetical protein